jgi:hypothetical protein
MAKTVAESSPPLKSTTAIGLSLTAFSPLTAPTVTTHFPLGSCSFDKKLKIFGTKFSSF